MKQVTLSILGLFFNITLNSQTIFGTWENRDEQTDTIDSIIEIYEKEGKAYAKIIEIIDPQKRDHLCTECKGTNQNKPILGMDILTGLSKDGTEWSGGEIFDPKTGTSYKCFIILKDENKLKIRAYLGLSLFGKTVYWQRKI